LAADLLDQLGEFVAERGCHGLCLKEIG
jgi:hypothetical protein